MKTFFLIITLLIAQNLFATTAEKVFDGTAATCPSSVDPLFKNELVFNAAATQQGLSVFMSTCLKGEWVLLKILEPITFEIDGHIVTETYTEFEVTLVQVNSKLQDVSYFTHTLPSFHKNAELFLSNSDLQHLGSTVDVSLSARKTTKASNGYEESYRVSWGSVRVFLNK